MTARRARAKRAEAPRFLAGMLGTLRAIDDWLSGERVPFALIGGVAASLRGRPRVTKDIDVIALVEESRWPALLRSAKPHQLAPRFDDALEFARATRVLLMMHEPTRLEVDVSFGMLPFEAELVERAEVRELRGVRFPLATAEDLMVMKALALRPRDVADLEGMLEANAALDLDRVRRALAPLSAALECEDHVARLDAIVEAVARRR